MTKDHIFSFSLCLFSALGLLIPIVSPSAMALLPSLIGLVFYVWNRQITGVWVPVSRNTIIFCAAILFLPAISLLWAKDVRITFKVVREMAFFLPPQILLISLAQHLNKERIEQHLPLYLYSFILSCILIVFEIFSGGILFNLARGQSLDTLVHSYEYNRIGVILSISSLALFQIVRSKIQHKLSFLIVLAPLAVTLYLSESLAAQLSCIAGYVTLFLFPYSSKWAWRILKTLIALVMIAAPFVLPAIYQNYSKTIQSLPLMSNAWAGHRLEIWDYVSRYAQERPLTGFGANATKIVTDFDSKRQFVDGNVVMHPHNFVIQIWMEFGLIGILIAILMMLRLISWIETRYSPSEQRILLPTLAAALVPLSFSYGIWQAKWLGSLFFLAAMALFACKFVQSPDKAQQN